MSGLTLYETRKVIHLCCTFKRHVGDKRSNRFGIIG